jgi:hypothetical protein
VNLITFSHLSLTSWSSSCALLVKHQLKSIRESGDIGLPFLNSKLVGVNGQLYASVALPPGKSATQTSSHWICVWVGPWYVLDAVRKRTSYIFWNRTRTVQIVGCSCTGWDIHTVSKLMRNSYFFYYIFPFEKLLKRNTSNPKFWILVTVMYNIYECLNLAWLTL